MSDVSPASSTSLVEQHSRDLKPPDNISCTINNTTSSDSEELKAEKTPEGMHTIPVTPSVPVGQDDLNNKLEETMAVPHEVGSDGRVNTAEIQPTEAKVVTPEAPKSSDKTVGSESSDPAAATEEDSTLSPPVTPPRVTSVVKGILEQPTFSPPKGFVVASRGRIVSLDRAKEKAGTDSDPFAENATDDEHPNAANSSELQRQHSAGSHDSSQADSSDGESSYFAKNLPSPKSGRRFSYSSTNSAPARTPTSTNFFNKAKENNKPSDASLSFSDESDEDDDDHLPHAESPEPVSQLPKQVTDMQLQRITRVHSASSLVSSEEGGRSPNSTLSKESRSIGSTSDPSVSAELQTVVASSRNSYNGHQHLPSGRLSPLPANAAFIGQFNISPAFSQNAPQASPPTIFQGYNAGNTGMLHPQPQMMTSDQLASWMAAGNVAAAQQHQQKIMGESKSSSKGSDGALPFVYSDDETDDTPFMNQLANGHGPPSDAAYNTFPNSNVSGGQGGLNDGNYGLNNNDYSAYQHAGQSDYSHPLKSGVVARDNNGGDGSEAEEHEDDHHFKVYWQRWVMLLYMSLLNLLSDWTCYSVAPIAILTQETFGAVDPERLVVIFLGANAIATACEPIILARLGLRKTVLFGALLLMLGSMVKSGGIPPIIQSELVKGRDEWRLSLGFFLVGLSQPLYQCTPALLSASWFPERERTMATGVALNANQLGIGCAFIFGTLLVADSDDIPSYFGLLSIISTLTFLGTLFQFDDAPPTPPSGTAKVMKGDLNVPDMGTIIRHVRKMSFSNTQGGGGGGDGNPTTNSADEGRARSSKTKKNRSTTPTGAGAENTRRRTSRSRAQAPAPSPALYAKTRDLLSDPLFHARASAPSPMMPGPVQQPGRDGDESPLYDEGGYPDGNMQPGPPGSYPMFPPGMPYMVPGGSTQYGSAQYNTFPLPNPYMDPRMQSQQSYYQQQPYFYPPPPHPYYYGYQNPPPMYAARPPMYPGPMAYPEQLDEGAEPVVTITDHKLDINIRDDQIILSTRACLSRPGFVHALVAFTVSGIVINTLSTFMDYLVTLNGAGREYVGIVGGSFQFIIMISSLIIGKQTDKTRAYYSVIIAMLVMGAFGLAECGVSLDADRGSDLRWSLLIVAALVGPLQPVSTELGVDVAYPLSENTVLVIQQLFSNLLSALFIPFFKSLRDVGISTTSDSGEKPQYTFSFYLLIVLHAGATVFFATFNGRYLRYEHELEKKAKEEKRKMKANTAFYPVQGGLHYSQSDSYGDPDDYEDERQPLTNNQVV